MSLSRLCEECRNCPYVDKCDNKRMEALGELPLPDCQLAAVMAGNMVTPLAAPILRETTTMVINGVRTEVYKDEIEKKLHDELSLYPSLLESESTRQDLNDAIARRIHEAICGIEYAINSNTYK